MKYKFLALLVLVTMVGCTTRSAYEGLRQDARRKCNMQPEPERSTCLDSLEDNYDTYKKKRDGTY